MRRLAKSHQTVSRSQRGFRTTLSTATEPVIFAVPLHVRTPETCLQSSLYAWEAGEASDRRSFVCEGRRVQSCMPAKETTS